MEQNLDPISRWECISCGSIITSEIKPNRCMCGCKDLEMLSVEWDEDKAREELGNCYDLILEVIEEFMDIPKNYQKIIALWILGTYFHDSFSTYPFLFINAMRGSGKTRLLNIISHLSKGSEGNVQTGITESVLFRSPKGRTLILDECESIGGKDKATLREYLNACYKRGGVVERARKNKDGGYEIETFHPYKPIAMANIWGMEEVLGDRCISLVLEKSNNPLKTKKLENFDTHPTFQQIKRTLRRFSVVCVVSFRSGEYRTAWNGYLNEKYNNITTQTTLITETTLKTLNNNNNNNNNNLNYLFNKIDEIGVDGRNFELLFPLLFVSNYLDPLLFEEILTIGKEIMDEKKEEEFAESRDVSLYDFVSKFDETGFIQLKELTNRFRIWLGESGNEHINDWWMGKSLKRLNLIRDKKRMASGRYVILNQEKAEKQLRIFRTKHED